MLNWNKSTLNLICVRVSLSTTDELYIDGTNLNRGIWYRQAMRVNLFESRYKILSPSIGGVCTFTLGTCIANIFINYLNHFAQSQD